MIGFTGFQVLWCAYWWFGAHSIPLRSRPGAAGRGRVAKPQNLAGAPCLYRSAAAQLFPHPSSPLTRARRVGSLLACQFVASPAQHHPRKKKEIVLTTTTIDQPGPHPFQSPSPLIKERLLLPTRVELPNLCYTTLLFLTFLYILPPAYQQKPAATFLLPFPPLSPFLRALLRSFRGYYRQHLRRGLCDRGPRIPDANTKPSR